ncbi:MAG: antirestriction protein ArdA [Methanoregulaceae archaeon]|jgi:antirestriction protein|nr:antirestriction protein ArdA [Methanoregulaceae archaeon]
MQIWVVSNKTGVGEWFDVGNDPDELHTEIEEFFETDDYTIDDSSPELENIRDYTLGDLCEIASLVDMTNEDAFIAWLNYNGDIEYVKSHFDEAYYGSYNDEEDFAREYVEGLYTIPDFIEIHIDWESVANDLAHDMDFVDAPGGGIYVFRCL